MHTDLVIICDSWKETLRYKNIVKETIDQLKSTIKNPLHTSISYSGGKDSITMLHLITKLFPRINVWHWDYGIFMPRKFENEILKNLKIISPKINLILDKRYSKDIDSRIGYKGFYSSIYKYIKEMEINLTIIGLRKEESISRKSRLNKGKFEYYTNNTRLYFPLSEWKWQDIWTYIYDNKLPYPEIYNLYGPLIGWNKVRFVTFFDPEFYHLGNSNLDNFYLYEIKD